MVNIYLFIELLHTANAVTTVDMLKAIQMENCKFANVVVLSDEKIVAQLDCKDSTDGNNAILNKIAKVNGVVQTYHCRGPARETLETYMVLAMSVNGT
jgi:hypothetical protein